MNIHIRPDHPPLEFFAHTLPNSLGTDQWELLPHHLDRVAELAEKMASAFKAGQWGRLLGLWHDLGKYSLEFQDYLRTANGLEAHLEEQTGKVDHSTAGAQHAERQIKSFGRLLAYCIAGHHAGLADAGPGSSSLTDRLKKTIKSTAHAPESLLNPGITLGLADLPLKMSKEGREATFQLAFFTRMLFSCLVDADFLATEEFCDGERAQARLGIAPSLQAMRDRLQASLDQKAAQAQAAVGNGGASSVVTTARQEVLAACRRAAMRPPGLFSLTVPTGGGKTLSSLAFALDHAVQHNRSRIIYAIPFTSIIEQTAGVFRDVFAPLGEAAVIEHHSNIDVDDRLRETPRSRLAAENWDAPLVVTTSVQLLESLFANRTSRCRKLHNIVNSVIILDEVQTLPVKLLKPCLAALNELVRNYGCTIVLCTATQPALLKREKFTIGFDPAAVHEIIPEPVPLYQTMKRVTVTSLGPLTNAELLDHLQQHPSFLAILNTRGHAAQVYRDLKALCENDEESVGLFYLSTLLCGAHRQDILRTIRQRLDDGLPCRVLSTSLIEAGVDVDFPVVFRSIIGLDSIAQAAGRCNRNGRLPTGEVFVFEPTEVKLHASMKTLADSCRQVLPDYGNDLLAPEAIHKYFELHYWKQGNDSGWDKGSDGESVMECFPPGMPIAWNFRMAANRFQIIDSTGPAIFVPHGDTGISLIEELREYGPSRALLRRLQRYTVTVPQFTFQQLQKTGDVGVIAESFYELVNHSAYDPQVGLRTDREGVWEPASLLC